MTSMNNPAFKSGEGVVLYTCVAHMASGLLIDVKIIQRLNIEYCL